MDSSNLSVRQRSGYVNSNSKLVCFLYLLMRDHLVSGVVEQLVTDLNALRNDDKDESPFEFTNGWLAQHAEDLASRLSHERTEETEKLADTIGRVLELASDRVTGVPTGPLCDAIYALARASKFIRK